MSELYNEVVQHTTYHFTVGHICAEEQRAFRESKCQLLDKEAKVEAKLAELSSREAAVAQRQHDASTCMEAADARDKAFAAEQVRVVVVGVVGQEACLLVRHCLGCDLLYVRQCATDVYFFLCVH